MFVAPGPEEWERSWAAASSPDAMDQYRRACWAFDEVLGGLLPQGSDLDALEVGCYPGGFMEYLHKRFGYRMSGIDYIPATNSLGVLLAERGVSVGEIWQGDFLRETPQPRFDVVASFGFVEHFQDPAAVIARHVEWLKPGGWLVIEMPHFRRAQWLLHRLFDNENLQRHNTRAMSKRLVRRAVLGAGLDIVYLEYFGLFAFWYESESLSRLQLRGAQLAARATDAIDRRLKTASRDLRNGMTSPFIICVARAR